MMELIQNGPRLMKSIKANKWFQRVVSLKLDEILVVNDKLRIKMNRLRNQNAYIQKYIDNKMESFKKQRDALEVEVDETKERNIIAKTYYLFTERQKDSTILDLEVKLEGLSGDFIVNKRLDWSY